jgi:uncharacterized protein (TIGR02271 family)
MSYIYKRAKKLKLTAPVFVTKNGHQANKNLIVVVKSRAFFKSHQKRKEMNRTPENKDKKQAERSDRNRINTGNVESASIPVIEEKLQVGKEVIETGKVHISKRVHEEEETIGVPLSQEEVKVERVPVNKYVEKAPPGIRQEGDTTIISVLKEVTVVEKRLMLVEEVHISKHKENSISEQKVKLRKEEVIVDRKDGESLNSKID